MIQYIPQILKIKNPHWKRGALVGLAAAGLWTYTTTNFQAFGEQIADKRFDKAVDVYHESRNIEDRLIEEVKARREDPTLPSPHFGERMKKGFDEAYALRKQAADQLPKGEFAPRYAQLKEHAVALSLGGLGALMTTGVAAYFGYLGITDRRKYK